MNRPYDPEAAARFLSALGGDIHHFQTFDDDHDRKSARLVYCGNGSFKAHNALLRNLNAAGAGVFVACQNTHGRPRKTANITEVRTVMADHDDGLPRYPMEPTAIVLTSSPDGFDRFQSHWMFHEGETISPPVFAGVMRRLAAEYGADPNACDITRCARLPGFNHMKDPSRPHLVRVVGGSRRRVTTEAFLRAYPSINLPPRPTVKVEPVEISDRYKAAAVAGVLADLGAAPKGHRNASLNRAAFRLGQLGFEPQNVLQIVLPTAAAIGLPHPEITKTTISAATAGVQNARSA